MIEQRLAGSMPAEVPAAALDRLTAAAQRQGLVDVAAGTVETPLGRMVIAVTDRGLVRATFADAGVDAELDLLAAALSPRVLRVAAAVAPWRRELEDYFAGRRRDFDLPVDWRLIRTPFTRAVLEATAAIPPGEVATYSDVAVAAQRPAAQRAAGNALASNPVAVVIPCHRVVPRSGGVGNYGGGPERKRWLLEHERRLA